MAELRLPSRLIHQATRYLLDRDTYAVTEHVEWLISNWYSIPAGQRALIETDVEEAFHRLKSDPIALGHVEIHKPTWLRLRSLWYIGD